MDLDLNKLEISDFDDLLKQPSYESTSIQKLYHKQCDHYHKEINFVFLYSLLNTYTTFRFSYHTFTC